MPDATILPVLAYEDLDEAINWLKNAFQFRERWRIELHRAQLTYNGGTIIVVTQADQHKKIQSLLVRVPDVNAHFTTAVTHGAFITSEPADYPYGERQYTAEDLNGHIWTFSQSIRDLSPEDWGGKSGEAIGAV